MARGASIVAAIGALALATGVGATAPAMARAPHPAAARSRVQTVIESLTRAAGRHPGAVPAADQFVDLQTSTTLEIAFRRPGRRFAPRYPHTAQALVTCTVHLSVSPGRRGRRRSGPTTVRFISPAGRAAWARVGRPPLTSECPGSGRVGALGYVLGDARFTAPELSRITRSPAAVYRRYFARVTSPAGTLDLFAPQLATIGFPPPLRATIMRALAEVPGIRVVTETRAAVVLRVSGRPGGISSQITLSRSTGAVLALRSWERSGFGFLKGGAAEIGETVTYGDRVIADRADQGRRTRLSR